MTEMLRDILTRLESMNEKLDESITRIEGKMDNKGDDIAAQGT